MTQKLFRRFCTTLLLFLCFCVCFPKSIWAQPNQWPPTRLSVLFLLTTHHRFVAANFFLFRTRPTSWSSWTMTWATGRLTPLVVQSIRRPCRNWPLMVCLGDVRGACGAVIFWWCFFVLKWKRVRKQRKPCWFGKLFFLGGWSRKPFHSKFSFRKFWGSNRFGGISR